MPRSSSPQLRSASPCKQKGWKIVHAGSGGAGMCACMHSAPCTQLQVSACGSIAQCGGGQNEEQHSTWSTVSMQLHRACSKRSTRSGTRMQQHNACNSMLHGATETGFSSTAHGAVAAHACSRTARGAGALHAPVSLGAPPTASVCQNQPDRMPATQHCGPAQQQASTHLWSA